jgi:hypothetical protein
MAADDTRKALAQHPLVDRLKPDPGQVAKKVVTLVGLPGKSDRASYQRLYLTAKLDYYAEFQISAMAYTEAVPADQSPIAGHEATSVTLARDATIQYIWATTTQPMDEFDLDIRLGTPGAAMATVGIATRVATCFPDNSICRTCDGTCDTCLHQATCVGHTCVDTQCQQNTCVNTQCQQNTCVNTQCQQNTCVNTQCQNTCVNTQCQQNTCVNTQCQQNTCVNTQCQTNCHQHTCANTCHTQCGTCGDDTCHRTCTCNPRQCQ